MVLLPGGHERALASNLRIEMCAQRPPKLVDPLPLEPPKLGLDKPALRLKVGGCVARPPLRLSSGNP